MKEMKISDQIILECVKKGQGNLSLAFIEASVKLSNRNIPLTINTVKDRWYKVLRHQKTLFSTSYNGSRSKNTKNILRESLGYSTNNIETINQLSLEFRKK